MYKKWLGVGRWGGTKKAAGLVLRAFDGDGDGAMRVWRGPDFGMDAAPGLRRDNGDDAGDRSAGRFTGGNSSIRPIRRALMLGGGR